MNFYKSFNLEISKFLQKAVLSKMVYIITNLVFIYFIYLGIKTSFFMVSVNRSLWLDEALLAMSFSKRTFAELFTLGEFEYCQSAPLVWVYLNKILASIFGYHEYVLRSISFISFILIIFSLIFIQRYFYKSKFPLFGAAIFANLQHALIYSNMFKQYEFDGFIALIILICYLLYKLEKIGYKTLAILWSILIWCSQISCFIEGGLLLSELLFSTVRKAKKNVINILIVGSLILLSFIIYYFAWASRITSVKEMQNYLGFAFFPLIPKNLNDINKIISLTATQIFSKFRYTYETLLLFFISLGFFVYKKDKAVIGIYLGFLITLFASYLKLYPICDRTCFFVFPLMILIFSLFFENIIKNNLPLKFVILTITLILLYNSSSRNSYNNKYNVYMKGEEVNQQIKFLRKNIKKDEMVYVYFQSMPPFQFKNGYDNFRIGKETRNNNIIFGRGFFTDNDKNRDEIKKILSYPKIYLVTSHIQSGLYGRIENLFQKLRQHGYLELVQYKRETPLWYFSKDKKDCKTDYMFKILGNKSVYSTTKTIIRIVNTGKAYLNDPYNQTYLENIENHNIYPLTKLVAPKEYIDIEINYKKGDNPKFTLKRQFGNICIEKNIITNIDKNL